MKHPLSRSLRRLLLAALPFVFLASEAQVVAPGVSVYPVEGSPFAVAPTPDSRHLFVSLTKSKAGPQNGLAAFSLTPEGLKPAGFVALPDDPVGMSLTHDGKLAVISAQAHVLFVDTDAVLAGKGKAALLGAIATDRSNSSVNTSVSPDDRFVFIADEDGAVVTVIDLRKARAGGFKPGVIVGAIPTGRAPISMIFSPDGKRVYITAQVAPDSEKLAPSCAAEGGGPGMHAPGVVMVADTAKAETDPAHAVIAIAPAGCNPVRLALSRDGKVAYVTQRKDNAVSAYDTARLLSDPKNARIGILTVGPSPVGVAVDDARQRIFVGASNRFGEAGNGNSYLSVIDASDPANMKTLGKVAAGFFPREMTITADGRWLVFTNFHSASVELVDLAAFRPQP